MSAFRRLSKRIGNCIRQTALRFAFVSAISVMLRRRVCAENNQSNYVNTPGAELRQHRLVNNSHVFESQLCLALMRIQIFPSLYTKHMHSL